VVSHLKGAITLQFHPDWPHRDRTVIESMAADGVYRSQFATGISNGGLTAFPGGDRWSWETRLFAGRYDAAGPHDRPVYGAWNRRHSPYGGAIRFGSAFVQLKAEAIPNATFCFPDSAFEPTDFGADEVLPRLCAMADTAGFDDLDDYVEAHAHGQVRFSAEVEFIALDPCFLGTSIEAAATRLGCDVRFHPGYTVATSMLDPEYRGPELVKLAQSLGDVLTPDVIGKAARSGEHDLQALKRVWHYLARFGRAGN
jgi:hypothetical protein